MKILSCCKTTLSFTALMLLAPAVSIAQPADPGTDPFATPVNGGVAFVAAIAFLYGIYRIYQLSHKKRIEDKTR